MENIKKNFGFGCMRLPLKDGEIDLAETSRMVDYFLEQGFNYFDTAHGYLQGRSETALKACLTSRYPREDYVLTNKLTANFFKTEADIRPFFESQLAACGVDDFDFYLMHAQSMKNFEHFKACRAYETAFALKAEGKVRHVGISFHDSAEVLDEALTKHPEVEFVQLQLNYIDWENDNVQSRKCYEVAVKHNKPIIVMEPVKGGSLASMNNEIQGIMKAQNPELSIPSWAVRFCAGLDNILTVLSGMSTKEQLDDNVSYMEHFEPLSDKEHEVLKTVVEKLNAIPTIPCTGCRYCVDDCPMQIHIPDIFRAVNHQKQFGSEGNVDRSGYESATREGGKASECLHCGSCEAHCPQHIHIIEELEDAAKRFEG